MREFRFQVDPQLDLDDRMNDWDKQLGELQSQGLTIRGRGPDEDEPLSVALVDAAAPEGAYVETYEVVPL